MTDDHDKPDGGKDEAQPPETGTSLDEQWGAAEAAPDGAEAAPDVAEPAQGTEDASAPGATEPAQDTETEPAPETETDAELAPGAELAQDAELEPGAPAPEPRATLAEIVAADAARRASTTAPAGGDAAPFADDGGDAADRPPRAKLDWTKRSTRIAVGLAVGTVVVAVVAVLSWLNSRDYYLICGAEKVSAERGSTFPWGRTALVGKEWKAIEIAPASECASRTFATRDELREVFVQVLLDEASHRLISARPEDIDLAERQLAQALLLTRSLPTKRATIANLQGDVEYWRAASEIKSVVEALDDAAGRFEAAAAKKPRHSTDAAEWSAHAVEMAKQLRRGPPALRTDVDHGPNAPPQFTGTETAPAAPRDELPPTANGASASPTESTPAAPAAPTPRPVDRPDAGLPTGGVLL